MAAQESRRYEVIHRPAWHVCVASTWFDTPCDGPIDWYIRETEGTATDGPYCRVHAVAVADKQNEQEATS